MVWQHTTPVKMTRNQALPSHKASSVQDGVHEEDTPQVDTSPGTQGGKENQQHPQEAGAWVPGARPQAQGSS